MEESGYKNTGYQDLPKPENLERHSYQDGVVLVYRETMTKQGQVSGMSPGVDSQWF